MKPGRPGAEIVLSVFLSVFLLPSEEKVLSCDDGRGFRQMGPFSRVMVLSGTF